MSFDESLNDRQTKTKSAAIRRIAFEFVEHSFQLFFWNACAVVDYPALDRGVRPGFKGTKEDFAMRRIPDRIADQVLKDPLQKTGICVNYAALR